MTINYSKQSYWDERYASDRDHFDWYQRYTALSEIIENSCPCPITKCRVLVPGCGNSSLSTEMIKDGYASVTSIDWSQVCIDNMKNLDPKGTYEAMDARDLTFEDGSFDLIIAKGIIDSLSCGENYVHHISKMLHEFHRVLTDSGTLICVSYGAPDQRQWYFDGEHAGEFNWTVDISTIAKPLLPNMELKLKGQDPNHYIYTCRKRPIIKSVVSEDSSEKDVSTEPTQKG